MIANSNLGITKLIQDLGFKKLWRKALHQQLSNEYFLHKFIMKHQERDKTPFELHKLQIVENGQSN